MQSNLDLSLRGLEEEEFDDLDVVVVFCLLFLFIRFEFDCIVPYSNELGVDNKSGSKEVEAIEGVLVIESISPCSLLFD